MIDKIIINTAGEERALISDKWVLGNLADKGIDFTGFIIKPGRTYLRRTSLDKCHQKIRAWERKGSPIDAETLQDVSQSLNSYLGMLRQVDGYNARKAICKRVESLFLRADDGCTKIRPEG